MKRTRLGRVGQATVLWAALATAACDGGLSMKGRVFKRLGAPADGKPLVMVDVMDTVLPPDLAPAKGCDIAVEQWTPAERAKRSNRELWTKNHNR